MSRTSRRLIALGATLVCATGLAATATGVTSAYFSDTKSGTVKGTVGYVSINVAGNGSGTGGMDLTFANLMPGEPKSVTFDYQSTGTGTQDLWITFPNVPALHALNNLGHYGYFKVTDSSSGVVFESSNLQDGRTLPSTNSCSNIFTQAGCWPLLPQYKVRSGLAAGATGTVTFTFAYSGDLSGGTGLLPNGTQASWNSYPSDNPPYSQAFNADAAGPAGNGLPYNVVATQVGQTP
jgi:hypothetical protein